MCDSSLLINVQKVLTISVELADGTRATSTLRGRIGIDTGRAWVLVCVAYYIPDMRLNVVCYSTLDEKGVKTTIEQEKCVLFDRRDKDTLADLYKSETDKLFVTKMSPATQTQL